MFRSKVPIVQVALAGVLVASAAYAAVSISYSTASTASIEVRDAPVVWSAGPDSEAGGYAADWSLSSNATYYSVTLKPVPEATVTWGNLSTLKNQDDSAHVVTISGDSVDAYPKILAFNVKFYRYHTDELVGTLDLTAASPSLALGTLAAGDELYARAAIQLDSGAGNEDVPASVGISLTVA